MTRRITADRRSFLVGSAAVGTAGLSGCLGLIGSEEGDDQQNPFGQFGSGREGRPEPGGTSIEDLPDLEGELHVYSGRNEFLVGPLVDGLESYYDGFELNVRYDGSSDLVNQISEAGDATEADVFYTVDASALGALADEGLTRSISDDLADLVPEQFRTDTWIGTSGRARTVPYNTDALEESDLPDSIMDYPEFDGDLGWAPSYGSSQSFVAAMRQLEGDEATREWLEGVVDAGIQEYDDEQLVCNAVNDGEIDAGFTNHYYIQRIIDGSSDPSIAATFTEGDAGAVFNVAGATVTEAAADPDLADAFVQHLLSAEAQEYFAVDTFEYPMISGVDPYGELPPVDELNVPDIDLSELSNIEETVDFMREVDGITL
ncbi:extracellular solute-binding protein [Natronococcus jeotgali]|uniref:Iron ABC transporter substrate-binding protein n=1 Tax=Natronococcus jeotgali DSM 18795 TaxID=1227498 RepID=L9XW13_9EURY|nr:extracellular solute-binding protein [Natronococcus jeotgali]ELY65611.1 iron ABC transporter substrate-binding protein [Natronococcus jeotgali DSM 18795]